MSEGVTRRAVLATGSMAAAAGARAAPAAQAPAMIVSTWDFGAAANQAAFARGRAGGSLIDMVEAGAHVPELDASNHSVGYGGYPDRDGHVTLDAVIMDDAGNVGAVAALENVIHAISVARAVMEHTPHVLLVGEGATRFARDQGFPQTKMLTPEAETAWREWLKTAQYRPVANSENQVGPAGSEPLGSIRNHDTLGLLARDAGGRLAGACTTSGMAFKMRGRVGDSPLAGCGLFVERGVGAATSSGLGEEVVRIAGTARVVASMRMGLSPGAACREAVEHIRRLRGPKIKEVQVGFLALAPDGTVGAHALLPGFTYAVTDAEGRTRVYPAPHLDG
ncbi:N(4)-(beta-N-acetylglucosaminyl)-L-asparaginase [Sphingomonas morindae]|uniref:N(4)-(Beta-N-acetylglucosaminyl)-L-asparaginase n=1 Tax=Sphingomonas morindae TaxID=1541170 RepID=A0ABY4X741_9SPHN|nr:N(4)-(beta-N-acetylglucosaminyl)-L-asparaginase [Sphingomonas morindae]USI72749.1 N(4)-(beta-N-acetylglucosaminyl)-L-asparaginase [Sphingomonas morindae]